MECLGTDEDDLSDALNWMSCLMTTLSPKLVLYRELFSRSLVYLRNLSGRPIYARLKDRSAYFETELIHNLPLSMFVAEFVPHDIHFLNYQAKYYMDKCSIKISPLYPQNVNTFKNLMDIVPDPLRSDLKWSFPPQA